MNNKKSKQAREVFLDFTMNDDNNLLEQINEIDKSFALNIPSETSKVTHAKVTMPKNEDKGNHVDNMRKSNLSIDLAGTNEIQPMSLDELVKETEDLIETISETVQETAKISAHKNDFIRELEATSEDEGADETASVVQEEAADVTFDATFVHEEKEVEAKEQEEKEPEVYTPHFINDELGNTAHKDVADIKVKPTGFLAEFADNHLFDEQEEDNSLLEQTGSFLLNTKDLHFFSKDEDEDVFDGASKPTKPTKPTTYNHFDTNFTKSSQKVDETKLKEESAIQQDDVVVPDATFATSASAYEQTNEQVTDVIAEEGTLVAKVEDIDVLLQKLDALSAKEMVNALPSHANRKQGDSLVRPFVHEQEVKEQLAALTREDAHDKGQTSERDKMATLDNEAKAIDNVKVDVDALKVELASVDGQQQSSQATMSNVQKSDVAQPSKEAARPNESEQVAQPQVAVQPATVSSKDFYSTRDLIDTQPINLSEIEKLTSGRNIAQRNTDPYLVAADIPDQSKMQIETDSKEVQQKTAAQVQDALRQKNVELKRTYEAIEAAPSQEEQFDISQFAHNFEQVFGQTKPQTDDSSSRTFYTDELQFEQNFQNIFNQATMQTVEEPAALMQTDELVGLHEAMLRVDVENIETKSRNEGIKEKAQQGVQDDAANGTTTVAPDKHVAGAVKKQRVSTINYAAYLEEDTAELVQPGTLVDNGLAFAKTDAQGENQQDDRADDATRLDRNDTTDVRAFGVHETDKQRPQVVPLRPTGRTKPKTFADMNTTLVNLSVVEDETTTAAATLQTQADTSLEVSTVQNARRRAIDNIDVDSTQLNAVKRTNQVLVMTIIGLMIVILALICFIIFNMYM